MATLTLRVEKPVAGGRMLARHDGAIVLVAGALPGEVVEAEVERTQRGTTWAVTRRVVEASPDRLAAEGDAACGGHVYAHVRYERQLTLKSEIVADAFARIARLPLAAPVRVAGSPREGYRMRARLHVRDGRAGFFREGTHDLCDAGPTRQLLPETLAAIDGLAAAARALPRARVEAIEVGENRAASERACHLTLAPGGDPSQLAAATRVPGLTGVSWSAGENSRTMESWGSPRVSDELAVAGAAPVRLTRHVRAFFQGNRYLLDDLVAHVLTSVPAGPVVDLYAGVGLFAAPLAARGAGPVVAVESDRVSAADLEANARPLAGRLRVHAVPVEAATAWKGGVGAAPTVIVDPPRTGLSRQALEVVLGTHAPRIVYVSCDVATLARDARAIVDRGYGLASMQAFDLFPVTAHVETVAVFERQV